MKIIGIDPGTNRMGYGVLEAGDGGRLYAVALGDIDLRRAGDAYEKLGAIFERVGELVERYRPDEMALEAPFMAKNPQSTLKLGRAQGVAMAAGLSRGLLVFEYAPRRVKQAITGNGAAAKEQVAAMLGAILGIEYDPRRLDATDGLAVALAHYYESAGSALARSGGAVGPRNSRAAASWGDFVAKNLGRIK